jgi:hypothetical protein
MTLFNDYPGTISVKEILMQWDWQSAGGYYTAPGGQTLIPIQTTDYIINFTIPTSVSIGEHLCTIYYIDSNNRQNFVGQGVLKIHDPNERTYLALKAEVQINLTSLRGVIFENPNATALLASANAAFANSTSFADSGDFIGAVSILKDASALIAGAATAETVYQSAKKAYLSDLSSATAALGMAKSYSYQSQNGTLFLGHAMTLYEQATFLASAGKYASADGLMRTAASLIDRANAAEQQYLHPGSTTTTMTSATASASSPVIQQTSDNTARSVSFSTTSTLPDSFSHATFPPPFQPVFPEAWVLGGLAGIVLIGSLLVVLVPRKR